MAIAPTTNSWCSGVLKAMGDKTRLLIIRSLLKGDKCGTEIALELELPQPHIAHHLGILKNAGLVSANRLGQRVCYSINPELIEGFRKECETIDLGCCRISFDNGEHLK